MGIELNNGQKQLVNDATVWWHHRTYQTFEISGPPGCGKTWIVNYIIDLFGIDRSRIAPMAYTGSAAINMRTKGMMNASTIFLGCMTLKKYLFMVMMENQYVIISLIR